MKMNAIKRWMMVSGFGLAALTASAGNLILVGDSTLAPRKPEQRIGSWGDSMGGRLAEGWRIVNVAIGGKTVKSIQSGKVSQWEKALKVLQPGDFVIVQFGINDAAKKNLVEIPEFKAEFAKFADEIRAKGATPVFCSPVTSGTYGKKDGKFVRNRSRARYGAAIREVAEEKKVDFVDMTELTSAILAGLDRAAGEDLYVGKSVKDGKDVFDTCHPSKAGAKRYGEAFIADAKSRKLPVAAIFR